MAYGHSPSHPMVAHRLFQCKRLTFEVKRESHTWDYHFMELPVGLDLIVGMDFMRKHDVILLTASLKVLFGNNVLNYAELA